MNKKLQKELFKKYPKLFKNHTKPISESCMGGGIEIDGDGWYDIIDELCRDIQNFCDRRNNCQVHFEQMKEKFGVLRVYFECTSSKSVIKSDYVYGYEIGFVSALCFLIECKSASTCEICGKSESSRCKSDSGLIKCMCYEHQYEVPKFSNGIFTETKYKKIK